MRWVQSFPMAVTKGLSTKDGICDPWGQQLSLCSSDDVVPIAQQVSARRSTHRLCVRPSYLGSYSKWSWCVMGKVFKLEQAHTLALPEIYSKTDRTQIAPTSQVQGLSQRQSSLPTFTPWASRSFHSVSHAHIEPIRVLRVWSLKSAACKIHFQGLLRHFPLQVPHQEWGHQGHQIPSTPTLLKSCHVCTARERTPYSPLKILVLCAFEKRALHFFF